MSIFPLPQFEADLEAADREAYERLAPPKTMVIRFGTMRLVGEYPYTGDAKPGCGSKIVVRTHRGTELGEMLTSTCPNAGCSKSVSRKEMLEYIENSGGKDYPFYEDGKVLRVATTDDMHAHRRIEESARERLDTARELFKQHNIKAKVIEVEAILGGERTTVFYTSPDRIDFRDLVRDLASAFDSRIQMQQVGARDEARITADYEKCGQHCCCKQFLKVLKPVSMNAAKVQKATLDPLKISGRCGRLMCCLRYEDQTYSELRKNLPHRKSRVGTAEGVGTVVSTQILTQLVRVRLEENSTEIAVPVEELISVDEAIELAANKAKATHEPDPFRGADPEKLAKRTGRRSQKQKDERQKSYNDAAHAQNQDEDQDQASDPEAGAAAPSKKKKRRRRRKKPNQADQRQAGAPGTTAPKPASASPTDTSGNADKSGKANPPSAPGGKKKRRRRRSGRKKGPGPSGEGGSPPPPPSSD